MNYGGNFLTVIAILLKKIEAESQSIDLLIDSSCFQNIQSSAGIISVRF